MKKTTSRDFTRGITIPSPAHRRHDIDDRTWKLLEPHLPGREGVWGGRAQDNRIYQRGVFFLVAAARRAALQLVAVAGFATFRRGAYVGYLKYSAVCDGVLCL